MIIADPNGNDVQSKAFQKQFCTNGTVGTWVVYTVPANTYHADTKEEANALAIADVNANGQAYANTNGSCRVATYGNVEMSQVFQRNNCGVGAVGSFVTVTVSAGSFQNTTQELANQDAQFWLTSYGQERANSEGVCLITPTPTISLDSSKTEITVPLESPWTDSKTITLYYLSPVTETVPTDANTSVRATFTYTGTSATLTGLPDGTYCVKVQTAGKGKSGYSNVVTIGTVLTHLIPEVTYAPTELGASGAAIFTGRGTEGATINCYTANTLAVVGSTTVGNTGVWSFEVSTEGSYVFTQSGLPMLESGITQVYSVASASKPSCDLNGRAFEITSIAISGKVITFDFVGANTQDLLFAVKQAGTLIEAGELHPTGQSGSITLANVLAPASNYTLTLTGYSCIGTTTLGFAVSVATSAMPVVTSHPDTLAQNGTVTFSGTGVVGATIKMRDSVTGANLTNTTVSSGGTWSLTRSSTGSYDFSQAETGKAESARTQAYHVAAANAVSCDNGANPFRILSLTVIGSTIQYTYDAANCTSAIWRVKNSASEVLQSGTTSHTSSSNSVTIAPITQSGTYLFELSGMSCTGTATYAFTVEAPATCDLPTASITSDRSVYLVGDTAVLTAVRAGGTSYEWYRNGVGTGVTSSTYTVSPITLATAGDIFKLKATNACGGGKTTSQMFSNEISLSVQDTSLPSCDNGSRPFSLLTVAYLSSSITKLRYQYDASNCVRATWQVVHNATVVQQGTVTHTSNTVEIQINPLVDGVYTFKLMGSSCNGTTSMSFTVGAGEPTPTPAPPSDEAEKVQLVNVSPLAFYGSIEEQIRRQAHVYGEVFGLLVPCTSLMPFQFIRPHRTNELTEMTLVYLESYAEIDLLTNAFDIGLGIERYSDYDVVKFRGTLPLGLVLPEGRAYLKMSDGIDTWFSEVMTLQSNTDDLLCIEYGDRYDIGLDVGHIDFTDTFRFKVWLPTTLGKPEYLMEQEETLRDGVAFIERQLSEKLFKFTALAPEFLCDALRIASLCDFIKVTQSGMVYDVTHLAIKTEWLDTGWLASLEAEFKCDTVIKKIANIVTVGGSFDSSFNSDYNNNGGASTCPLPSVSLTASKTSVTEGGYLELTATVSGATAYVWYKNDTLVDNTGERLVLNNIPLTANNDVYKVVATNACATGIASSVTSNLITLVVSADPAAGTASLTNIARNTPKLTAYSQKPNWSAMRVTAPIRQGATGHKEPKWIVIGQLGHNLFDVNNKPWQNGFAGSPDLTQYLVRGVDYVFPSNPDTGQPWSQDPYSNKTIAEFVGLAQEYRVTNFLNTTNDLGDLATYYSAGASQSLHEYFGKGDWVNGKTKGLFVAMDVEVGDENKKLALMIGAAEQIYNGLLADESTKTSEMYAAVYEAYGILDADHNRITTDYLVNGQSQVGSRLTAIWNKANPLRISIPTKNVNNKSVFDYPCIIPTQEISYYAIQGAMHGSIYDLGEGKSVTVRKYGANFATSNVQNAFNIVGVLHTTLALTETFARYCNEVIGQIGLIQDKPIYDKGANAGLVDYVITDSGEVSQNPADKKLNRRNLLMTRKLLGCKLLIAFMNKCHTHQWSIAGDNDGDNYNTERTFDGWVGFGAVRKMIAEAGGDDAFRSMTPLYEDTEYSLDGVNYIKTKGVDMNYSYTDRLPVRVMVGSGAYAGLVYVFSYREEGIEPLEFWTRVNVLGTMRVIHVTTSDWDTFNPDYPTGTTIPNAHKDYYFKPFIFTA